jgi:hypothetical protein
MRAHSLRACNQNDAFRIRRLHGALITFGSRGVHSQNFRRSGIICFADSGNGAGTAQKQKMESNMLNKLLAATAMAVIAYATCPANAAKVDAGCSGGNLTKAESMVEAMAEGDAKIMAQKEISLAQDAMLGGKMGVCASHLGKAMHAGMAK